VQHTGAVFFPDLKLKKKTHIEITHLHRTVTLSSESEELNYSAVDIGEI